MGGGNISYAAKSSDKKVFCWTINELSDFEIPSPWISIGIDSNNIKLSFEKILGKYGFDWEEIEDDEGKHAFSYKQLNTGLFLVLVIDNECLGIFLGTEEMKNRSYHDFVSRDFQDEEGDNDVEVPSCPNCGSDDVKDDGSGYLQYKCNGCGNIWGHDDKEECPECGSHDIEDDVTGYFQYKCCNNCGHIWQVDELDYDDQNNNDPIFQKLCSIVTDKLGVEKNEVTLWARFVEDFGADSLDLVELVMEIEKEFGISIPDDIAENLKTVGETVDYIRKNA